MFHFHRFDFVKVTASVLIVPCLFVVLLVTAGNIASAADGDQWSLGGDMQVTSNPSPAISPSGDVSATWSYYCGGGLCTNSVSGDISSSVNLEMPDQGIGWNVADGHHQAIVRFDTDANLVPDGDDKTVFQTGQVGGHAAYHAIWTSNFNGEVTLDYLGYNAREQDGEWVHGHERGRTTNFSVAHNGVQLDSTVLEGGPATGIENAYTGTATVDVVPGDEIMIAQAGGEWCGIDLTVTVGEAIPPGPERGWTVDRSDSWHVDNHWTLRDAPNSNKEIAVFGDVISRSRVVVLEDDVTVQGAQFVNSNTYAIVGVGSLTLDAGEASAAAVDVLLGNHEFQAPVNLSSDAQATIANGATLTFNNALNLGGNTLTKIGPGTLEINNNVVTGGGTVNCQGGNCSGTGTIGGDLVNSSLVAPGNSPGILSVDGNFTQSAGGTLEIELASNGGVAGTDHDRLAVTLAASLDGTLDMQLDGGYSPTIGDSFAGIVTAGTVSGSFATTNNVVIDGRQGVAVTYTETAVNAQIGLRGNTDIAAGDIDVDTSDLTTSIINFTSAGGTGKTWADGDMDGDGDVDTSDLTTSIINFTSALSSGSAAVPEPTSFVLLSLGMVLLLGRSRSRR